LQNITNQLLNVFTDSKGVTKSYIPVVNTPTRIEVLIERSTKIVANKNKARHKHGKPIGSKKQKNLKKKEANNQVSIIEKENIHKDIDITNHKTPEEVWALEN